MISDELMRDAAKLWLRIFEVSYGATRIAVEIANVIVWRIGRRFVPRQNQLGVVIQRRDDSLIDARIAAE